MNQTLKEAKDSAILQLFCVGLGKIDSQHEMTGHDLSVWSSMEVIKHSEANSISTSKRINKFEATTLSPPNGRITCLRSGVGSGLHLKSSS